MVGVWDCVMLCGLRWGDELGDAGVNIAEGGREWPAETGGRGPWFSWIPGARVLLRTGPAGHLRTVAEIRTHASQPHIFVPSNL